MLITPGLLTAMAIFILIMKLRTDTTKKLLGFDIPLDIAVTVMLMVIFSGTFGGMMAAIVGGLTFSLTLVVAKWVYGYKKLTIQHSPDHFLPAIVWIDFPPIWSRKERRKA